MSNISKAHLKKIAEYIINNFNGAKIQLDSYLVQIAPKFSSLISTEDYQDYLCDSNSPDYFALTNILLSQINKSGAAAIVKLIKNPPFFYIENTMLGVNLKSSKIVILEYLNILDSFQNLDAQQKGNIFEQFCYHFLIDIGFQKVIKTPSSSDFGIDIVAKVPVYSNSNIFKYILRPDIYLLIQCKYFSGKVDTPIIRHIIGDSFYYRMNDVVLNNLDHKIAHSPLYLFVISHNGFTNQAHSFANANAINTLDSTALLNIACQHKDAHTLSCLKYLKELQAKSIE
jgi:Restriction endonuclease.